MARPAKKNCDYFPHDAGMRNHKKIKALRTKFGVTGYAVWCMLLEHLTGSDFTRFEYSDLEFELLSGDFGVSATEIREIVDYCFVLGLLVKNDGWILSESLNERLEPVFAKRERAKEFLQQQPRSNGRFSNSNTDTTVVSVTEMPQKKRNEIKGNEKKGDESTPAQSTFEKFTNELKHHARQAENPTATGQESPQTQTPQTNPVQGNAIHTAATHRKRLNQTQSQIEILTRAMKAGCGGGTMADLHALIDLADARFNATYPDGAMYSRYLQYVTSCITNERKLPGKGTNNQQETVTTTKKPNFRNA